MQARAPWQLHVIFVVAGIVSTLAYALLDIYYPIGGGGETVKIAESLVREGTYGNPFITANTGPTALITPLYPLYLAGLFKLFGFEAGRLAAVLLTVLAHGIHASLLLGISGLFFGDVRPGVYGAALSVLLPSYRLIPAWDAQYTAVALMLLCLLAARLLAHPDRVRTTGLLLGLAGGLLVLLNPSSVLVFGPWLIALLVRRDFSLRNALHLGLPLAGALTLTCLPWILRNYERFGSPVLKSNFGMTFYASNNDCAQPGLGVNLRTNCYQAHNPFGSVAEARLIYQMGEPRYDRYRMSSGIHWVRENPGRFAKLTALRALEFWFPEASGGPYNYSLWPVTVLSMIGLMIMRKRREPVTAFILLVFLIYPLMYYVSAADSRYRYPILWLSFVTAGYAMAAVRTRLAPRPGRVPSHR